MTEVYLISRLLIGAVFLLSVVGKLEHPRSFTQGIEDYEILPAGTAAGATIFIIIAELFLAIAHLMGWWLRVAVPVGLVVLASFAVAVAVNLVRGRKLPCYCFSTTGGEEISPRTLARLLLLLSTEIFLLVKPNLFAASEWINARPQPIVEPGLTFFWVGFLWVVFSWLFSLPEIAELLTGRKTVGMQGRPSHTLSDHLPADRSTEDAQVKRAVAVRLTHLGSRT